MPNLPKVSVNKLSQRGAIHYLIPILLILGIIGGVYLTTAGPLKLKPKASVSGPVGPVTSFTLASDKSSYKVGDLVEVKILVRSDVAATNLFAAKINYDQSVLQLGRVDTTSFVTNWVEQYWGDAGKISLTGGMPAPGLQPQVNAAPSKMATLYFTTLKAGTTNITFADDSAIYDNANNLNILGQKVNSTITIGTGATPTPTPGNKADLVVSMTSETPMGVGTSANNTRAQLVVSIVVKNIGSVPSSASATELKVSPAIAGSSLWRLATKALGVGESEVLKVTNFAPAGTYQFTATVDADSKVDESNESNNSSTITHVVVSATPAPSATPLPGTGDGNGNGKSDLGDMSVLLTDFNKETGFRKPIDMNGDGKINTFDFALMRNLLIQNKIIKG